MSPPTPSTARRPGGAYVPPDERYGRPAPGWRADLFRIIFESDTRAGLRFDQVLIVLILASLVVVVAAVVLTLPAGAGAEPGYQFGPWLPNTVKQLNQLGTPLREHGITKGSKPLHELFRKYPAYFKVLPLTGQAKQVRLEKAP